MDPSKDEKSSYYKLIVNEPKIVQNQDDLVTGSVQFHESTKDNPCSFWTYIPKYLNKSTLTTIVVSPRSSETDEKKNRDSFEHFISYFKTYNFPGLMIVNMENGSKLKRNDLLNINQKKYRADLHLYDCIFNQFLPSLEKAGFRVNSKIFLVGYSGPGDFSYRFCIMYPNKVKAVCFGGSTGIPLPMENIKIKPYIFH
jgi:hypothetical protein